jgi:hypothetical protein
MNDNTYLSSAKGGEGKQRGLAPVKYVEFRNLLKLGISLDDKARKSLSSNEIPSFSKFLNSTYFTESKPRCLPLPPLLRLSSASLPLS